MKYKYLKFIVSFSVLLLLMGCQKDKEKESGAIKSAKTGEVTIYFARHGKTMLNTTDRSQGWIDAPLTPAGIKVAEHLGKGLKVEKIKFDAVYSSDSGRAVETAACVLKHNGQKSLVNDIIFSKRLREFNFGSFEGMPNEEMWETVAKAQGKTLESWRAELATDGFVKSITGFSDTLAKLDKEVTASGVNWPAEAYTTVVKRAKTALDDIVKQSVDKGHKQVLVTSHGMTIAALISSLDATVQVPVTGLKNASISKVVYRVKDKSYQVLEVNEMRYVAEGESV